MPALGHSTAAFARAQCASGENDQDNSNHEVDDLHHFVKSRHFDLEEIDEAGQDETGDPWLDERSEAASVKKPAADLTGFLVGMRIAHADNSSVMSEVPQMANLCPPGHAVNHPST